MLTKLISQLLLIQFLLGNGCVSENHKSTDNKQIPMIILNGNKVELDENSSIALTKNVEKLLEECDDFYELIVSEQVIETIKNEQFLEIQFTEEHTVETGKFKNLTFDKMLIPLTGKFHSSGQITFFTGLNNFSNTPLVNSNGSYQLEEALKKITR